MTISVTSPAWGGSIVLGGVCGISNGRWPSPSRLQLQELEFLKRFGLKIGEVERSDDEIDIDEN
jgi:hypothetical protein